MLSAGILPYRRRAHRLEVLIAHPGGPLWRHRDRGAWSIVKGVVEAGEDPFDAAVREFSEETGWPSPSGPFDDLGEVVLKSGKRIVAWASPYDADPGRLAPGTFEMEWPRGSGRLASFPEIDRVAWMDPDGARAALNPRQVPFVERLILLRGTGR